jgi:hypothetical protein
MTLVLDLWKHPSNCSLFPKIHWTVTMTFDCLFKRTALEGYQVLALMVDTSCPSLFSSEPAECGWERGGEGEFERFCIGLGGVFVTQNSTENCPSESLTNPCAKDLQGFHGLK